MTDSTSTALATTSPADLAFLHDTAALDHRVRLAKAFSNSGMVPPHFQGKPEACLVAMLYAEQLGEHPMLLFQEMSVINGRPCTSARFAISRANKSGLLQGPITWKSKGQGEALEVTASATLRETGEVITAMVSMKEAQADGWTRNQKYKSIPEQMLRWRAATRLINLYMPEVLFGLGVREEGEVRQVTVREESSGNVNDTVVELNKQIAASAVVDVEEEPVEDRLSATLKNIARASEEGLTDAEGRLGDAESSGRLTPDQAKQIKTAIAARRAELNPAAASAQEGGDE